MSTTPVGDIIDRMRVAQGVDRPAAGQPDREKLKTLAAQFESMLLVQMLRGMREAGKWDDDESPEAGGFGADALFETIDTELANHLSAVKGLGLSQQLLRELEKYAAGAPGASAAGTPGTSVVPEPRHVPGAPEASVPGELRTAPVNAPAPTEAPAGGPVQFTVAPGSVTSSYGWRRDPLSGDQKFHRGIDVRAAYGDDIQAAGSGRVVFSGEQRGYGTTVVVEHGNGVRTRYAHLSAAVVQAGDEVASGQVLGRAGRSGRATGTHLHFEVTANGRHVNPAEWGLVPPGQHGQGT